MTQRQRKFLGTLATLAFLIAYSLVVMALGGMLVVGRGVAFELSYYMVTGVLWLPVVMMLIRWMSRPG